MPTIRNPVAQRAQKSRAAGEPNVIRYDPDLHPGIVRRLAILGLTREKIASILGISPNTLVNWAKRHEELCLELEAGCDLADAEVVASLYDQAVGYIDEEGRRRGCNVAAGIFWMKARCGWSDRGDGNRRGEEDKPKEVTLEELAAQARDLLKKAGYNTGPGKTTDDAYPKLR